MAGFNLGWATRLALVVCVVALAGFNWAIRRDPNELSNTAAPATAAVDGSAEPLLINDDWHIRNMATAHGAFVIEVEADDPSQAATIARALVEPIKDDYDEVLVYVNQRGGDSDLPDRRLQWTPRDGYVEIAYDQTSP
jgi:hypothetical protein